MRVYIFKWKFKIVFFFIILFSFILYEYNCNRDKLKVNHVTNYKYFKGKENDESKKLKITTSLLKIFSELYDYIRDGYTKPRFSNILKDYSSQIKNNFNICICVIGKNENLYAREFIEYYLSLGVNKIIIYDNNDYEGEKFQSVLDDILQNKKIEIIDVRGLSSIQIPIYNYCYRKNSLIYDWIAFLDFDEYLYIENNENINSFLYHERFNKCQSLFFNWVIYNDNDLLRYDNRRLIERFTHASLNLSQGKSFVRGKIENFMMPSSHIPGINVFSFCNSNGELIYPKNFFEYKFEQKPKAFIKHFYTKTAEEFCNKINQHAHFHKRHPNYLSNQKSRINFFFKINKKTSEKLNIIGNCSKANSKKL